MGEPSRAKPSQRGKRGERGERGGNQCRSKAAYVVRARPRAWRLISYSGVEAARRIKNRADGVVPFSLVGTCYHTPSDESGGRFVFETNF